MSSPTPGLHHVTALSSHVQRTLDFFAGVLGLRLVKRTVNFDDPATYHFYFGGERGTPGTLLTFFPMHGIHRGRAGAGQAAVTSLLIRPASVGYWLERLVQTGVKFETPKARFDDERVIALKGPDDLMLELVAHHSANDLSGWPNGPVPDEYAIRGLYGVTLWLSDFQATAELLTGPLGFTLEREQGSIHRFRAAGSGGESAGMGRIVDIRHVPGLWQGTMGAGTVHHVAFRAADADRVLAIQSELHRLGLSTTSQIDRHYFRSIYFREPGGVLLELATDQPGFTIDEAAEELGSSLKLPPWLESQRAEIESALPSVKAFTDSGRLLA